MSFRTKAEILVVVLVVAGFLWLNRTRTTSTPLNILKPNEKERVVFNTQKDTVSVLTPKGTTIYTGVRHAEVSVSSTGKVTVQSKQYGLCLEPGLGAAYRTKWGAEGDVQFAYYHHFGAHVGVYGNDGARGFLGVGYNLSRIYLSNTSIILGLDNRKDILGLIRVRL